MTASCCGTSWATGIQMEGCAKPTLTTLLVTPKALGATLIIQHLNRQRHHPALIRIHQRRPHCLLIHGAHETKTRRACLNSTTKHFGKGAGMLFRILLLTKHQKTPHLDPPQGQQGLFKVGLSAPRSYQGVFISRGGSRR